MPKAPPKVDPAKEAAKAAAKVEKACNDLVKACKDDGLAKAKKGAAAAATPCTAFVRLARPPPFARSGRVGRGARLRRHGHRLHPHARRRWLRLL